MGAFVRIGGLTQTMPDLDDSDLGNTTLHSRRRGDLIDLQPIECEVYYDPDDPPPFIASEQWIITFPFPSGSTIVGTGFLTEDSSPELINNELMMATLSLQFDGQSGPLFIDPTDTFSPEFSTEFA